MSPLFMCESDSPGSAEDCHGNKAGIEREGEGQSPGPQGSKRRESNRDAARKSRKKQTERADQLHEELQSLERSNSALQKEIEDLKKQLHFYEMTLKRHESHCHLKTSPNSSDFFTDPSISHRSSSQAIAPSRGIPTPSSSSLCTSKSASQDCKTLNYNSISLPVPRTTSGASSVGPPSRLFASCSTSVPYSLQLSTHEAPIASRPPGLPSNSAHLQPGQHNTLQTSSAYFTVEPKHDPSMTASPDLLPPFSLPEVQNSSAVNQASVVHELQPHSFQSSPNVGRLNLLHSLYHSPHQNPAPGSGTALPPSNPEPNPALTFNQKSRHFHQAAPNAAPLPSQFTVLKPFTVSQTANSFYASPTPPLQSHPPPEDRKDLSLSDFLENNDWVLTVNNKL